MQQGTCDVEPGFSGSQERDGIIVPARQVLFLDGIDGIYRMKDRQEKTFFCSFF
jgi:hypothetical protein